MLSISSFFLVFYAFVIGFADISSSDP
jgi:hypothetical protein